MWSHPATIDNVEPEIARRSIIGPEEGMLALLLRRTGLSLVKSRRHRISPPNFARSPENLIA